MSVRNAMEALNGTIQQMIENDRQKLGGMTPGASFRLGLEELRQAAVVDGSVADQTHTPLGMYGTPTPGEVSAARQETTVHGPKVEEAVEKQTAAGNDPVADAQRQAKASKDTTPGKDGHDASR